ncbi:histidine phosphatase family protein [Paraburkholderia phenazinium]|uniref:Phosphoglycerate mutase n=1 Tax=Paraburkholderia phenazinium TaxID=60549 RepID=A0A1G8CRE0_9BURK|nr:histidine phosphatase family protein [Paraburkholderia phenazinium]SDH48055.1 phosphoglycerate mutase [Paraburkholderia phenazinium]
MSTQILFIRHGETDWNRIKRIQGHIDIPLATSGLEQAERLARRLADEAQQGGRIDAVYSSDLQRAQQTAQPIAHVLGLPLNLREGLRERSYGAFQGYDRDEIAERYPDEYDHWQTRDAGFAPPEGESMRAFYHRVMDAITPIVSAHRGGRVACVAHGGVLDCVYRFARDLSLEVPRDYALLNTSVNVVEFDGGGKATVKSWADVSHLDAPSEDDTLRKIVTPGL